MAIEKLNFKFINEIVRNEQIKKLADKVNEVIDGSNPLIDHISYDSANNKVVIDKDLDLSENDLSAENINVNGTLNIGANQSAKKIYCHPISIYNYDANDLECTLSLLIFNNSETPFTKDSLVEYIKNIPSARFLCNGIIYDTDTSKSTITSYIYYTTNTIYVIGIDNDGGIHNTASNIINFETLLNNASTTLYDGVNAIN